MREPRNRVVQLRHFGGPDGLKVIRLMLGLSSPRFSRRPIRRISNTSSPRPNLRVWCHKKEAIGHGVRAKRSKTGAVSFNLMTPAV